MRRLYLSGFVLMLMTIVPLASAETPQGAVIMLSGYVRDARSGAPIAGAQVTVGSETVVTGVTGSIPATPILLASAAENLTIVVTADGFTAWRFEGFAFRAGVPVELRVLLSRVGSDAPVPVPAPHMIPTSSPPEYIDVGRTYTSACVVPSTSNPIPVQRMRFDDYVRNVLPNEWLPQWGNDAPASLDAGAVAVKEYAWYTAVVEQKWRRRGYQFDLIDNGCDQYYRDNSTHPATDAAIERTWDVSVRRDGAIFPLYFRARDEQCPIFPGCMGQYGSYYRALAGETGDQILLYYYAPAVIDRPQLVPQFYLPLLPL